MYETASHTDIGARQKQEDRAGVFEKDGAVLLAVCDGMGGHPGGDLAAEAVVEIAGARFEAAGADGDGAALLASIIAAAHQHCRKVGSEETERWLDPHTTCVLLLLTPAGAHWAHVGDSRLYRFENGKIAARTLDHSKVEELRLEGWITEEQMADHPDQNWVLQAVGAVETPEPSADSAPPEQSEAFLLATDGLWENATREELEAAIADDDLPEALRGLVAGARKRGGPRCDNITVAVARRKRDASG